MKLRVIGYGYFEEYEVNSKSELLSLRNIVDFDKYKRLEKIWHEAVKERVQGVNPKQMNKS